MFIPRMTPVFYEPDDETGAVAPVADATDTVGEGEGAPVAESAPEAAPVADHRTPEFYESELRRARDEAAERRVALKKFEEAFDGYESHEVDKALQLYRALADDPTVALKEFKEITARLEEMVGPVADDEPKYLTEADLEAREQQKRHEAEVTAILTRATELGYEEGTDTHAQLLHIAAKNPEANGDLDKAHEILTKRLSDYKEQVLQEYLAGLSEQDKFPPVSSGGAGTPDLEPGKVADPRVKMREILNAAGYGLKK
jgi:hypothetical protein